MDSLYLDHLYRVADEKTFQVACEEFPKIFPNAQHRVTKTSDGLSWEGVYIYSHCGIYFELLKGDANWNPRSLGLCVSRIEKNSKEGERLLRDYPQHPWIVADRKYPSGESWYKYTMIDSEELGLCLWTMDYAEGAIAKRKLFGQESQNPIEEFTSLDVSFTTDRLKKTGPFFDWMGNLKNLKDKSKEVLVPRKGLSPFCLKILNSDTKEDNSFILRGRVSEATPPCHIQKSGLEIKIHNKDLLISWKMWKN